MGVKHSPRLGRFNNALMQRRFGTGFPFAGYNFAVLIHHDQLIRTHLAFVHTTGRHKQMQGLPLDHHAEIPSGAIAPAALVDVLHHLDQAVALGSAGVHSPGIPSSSIQETEAALH
tara:strand:- start:123 stop:470 length:348 start_codon:yes stop_codon:yes gene_type:complete